MAAHWDYKLQNKATKSLPGEPTLSGGNATVLALPSARTTTATMSEMQSADANVTKALEGTSGAAPKGRIASYIEALATSREAIVRNNLFVFLSSTESALDGRIVSIDPSALNVAKVLKRYGGAAMEEDILEDISAGALEVYRNGVSTSLDEEILNRDILTLPVL